MTSFSRLPAIERQPSRGRPGRTLAGSLLAVIVAGSALAGAGEAAAAASPQSCGRVAPAVDPFQLYGERIEFQVRRNGDPVGTHTLRFIRDGGQIKTETRFEVKIDVLFVTAYRYVYQSTANWAAGCLLALEAVTDDDGKTSAVRVWRDGPSLIASGPETTASAAAKTLPTEHWDADVVRRDRVVNTITGRIDAVDIEQVGTEQVRTVDGALIPARHYAYTGDLRNEVWYDSDGRWVKMRFTGTDGSTVDYVCVKCARGAGS